MKHHFSSDFRSILWSTKMALPRTLSGISSTTRMVTEIRPSIFRFKLFRIWAGSAITPAGTGNNPQDGSTGRVLIELELPNMQETCRRACSWPSK